ncbi:MAG: hypothetical protein O9340_05190 [Cyclobacteriaceae bacterium]|nr:hypothetical protein [Cyclobacteriaceae bacterium]
MVIKIVILHNIILISTVHNEIGKCNSDELSKILQSIKPDVIFLEAFENSYSDYHQMLFSQFGIFNDRLEVKTMQIYSQSNIFEYVPVLDIGLSEEFEIKTKIISENISYQRLLDNYILLETHGGFQFLNSIQSVKLQEEMRSLEYSIINDVKFHQLVNSSIDAYENSMLSNIYSYCKRKPFKTAIFMCGAAHRKTITEKIVEFEKKSEVKLNWSLYSSDV